MVVEPESFCWSSGRLVNKRDGQTWADELRGYSSLEYIVRDAGTGLSKGISLVQAERPGLRDGLDVFHTLHEGGKRPRKPWRGTRWAEPGRVWAENASRSEGLLIRGDAGYRRRTNVAVTAKAPHA